MGGGEVVACNMARVLKDDGYRVIFACGKIISTQEIKDKLGIDLSDIEFKIVQDEQSLKQLTVNYPSTKLRASKLSTINLFINISFMDYSYGIGKRNIYYVHFPSKIRSGLFNYILQFFQKTNLHLLLPGSLKERVNDRLCAGIYPDMKKGLDSYDTFITHSEYVNKWTRKLWNKDAHILYPPVNLIDSRFRGNDGILSSSGLTRGSKNNWIVSIGRFFTLGHGKKQEIMIEAFKRLTEAVKESEGRGTASVKNGWQLHLVGGVGNEPSSLRFIKKLQEQAKGYPIYFHFNATRQEVEEILLKSKIYWHAGGYGEDAEHDPIKFEHFGIAPIEAISAGCIPILYDGGGLPEIIHLLHFKKTNLFQTVTELISNTLHYLDENTDNNKLLKGDLEKYFSSESFKRRFKQLVYE